MKYITGLIILSTLMFASFAIPRPVEIDDQVADFCAKEGCVIIPAALAESMTRQLEMCGTGMKGAAWTSKTY